MLQFEKLPAFFNIDEENKTRIEEILRGDTPCTMIVQVFTLSDHDETVIPESSEEIELDQNDLAGGDAVLELSKNNESFDTDTLLNDALSYQIAQLHREKLTAQTEHLAPLDHKLHVLGGALYHLRMKYHNRAFTEDGVPTITGTPKLMFVAMVYDPGKAAARSIFMSGDIRA